MCNTMRTSIVCAAFLGLFVAGCAGELSGTGDDEPTENCGNGVVDSGETCDDSNIASGDGCSAACQTEGQQQTPRLDVTVDKLAVNTELNTSTMLTVAMAAGGGFGGDVMLTGTAEDPATGAPLTGWTVTFNQATVSVPVNGQAMAVATVRVPSQNSGLMANVKINVAAGGTVGTKSITSAFTALNQVTFEVTNNGTQCVYPSATPLTIKVGTKVRFVNKFTAGAVPGDRITIHFDGNTAGLTHQADPGHLIDAAYEDTATAPSGGQFNWYCHAPGPNLNGNNPKFIVAQ